MFTIWLVSPFCLWFRATGSSNCMNRGGPLRQLKIQLIQQLLRLFWILQLENCVGQLTDGADCVEGNPGVVFGPAGWTGPPPRPILHQPIRVAKWQKFTQRKRLKLEFSGQQRWFFFSSVCYHIFVLQICKFCDILQLCSQSTNSGKDGWVNSSSIVTT